MKGMRRNKLVVNPGKYTRKLDQKKNEIGLIDKYKKRS